MAPRSVKAKKAADVKVSENEAPKKGRGKNKVAPELEADAVETEEDKVPVTEKKNKRGKKAAGTEEKQNGDEVAPAKKGKKKNEEDIEDEASNDDKSEEDVEESAPAEEAEQDDDDSEANGHSEEVQAAPTGRGRKKPTKKEPTEKKPKETNRGKRNAKQTDTDNDSKKDLNEDKPKGRGRGRKAQPKPEADAESDDKPDFAEEEVKPTASRGRKKAPVKSYKEKSPDSEDEESPDEIEEVDEEPKKTGRGKKNAGRKPQPKAESEDNEEEMKGEPATKKQKVTKKEEKAKGGSKDEEDVDEEEAPEAKPVKGKRGRKKAVEKPVETEEELQDTGEPTTKRKRKPAEDKASSGEPKKAQPKSKNTTDYESIDFSNTSKNSDGKEWNLKIASWNVDGIRAWMVKGGLDYIKREKPDILCLQELKCAKDKLPDEIANLPGYHAYWLCSDKDGYAGVGIYTTKLAMNVQYGLQDEDLDTEGRIITAEYEQFYLICTYVPNSGRKLVTLPKRLKWNEEFLKHVKSLDKKKPVIICGDMNVSHAEIDLTNPKTNKKNAGFTDEERAGMTEMLGEGFVDTYRHLYPDKTGAYTFWTYMFNSRAKNVGWRLDYFILSERLLPALCDNTIRDKVYGSDHCPITLFLHLTSADKPKE